MTHLVVTITNNDDTTATTTNDPMGDIGAWMEYTDSPNGHPPVMTRIEKTKLGEHIPTLKGQTGLIVAYFDGDDIIEGILSFEV